jgi:hypothetical protein
VELGRGSSPYPCMPGHGVRLKEPVEACRACRTLVEARLQGRPFLYFAGALDAPNAMIGIRDDVLFRPEQNTDVLVAELCEIEMGDPVGVGEEVDFGDLAVLTVRAAIENGLPCRKATMPAAPLMRAWRMVRLVRDQSRAWLATVTAPRDVGFRFALLLLLLAAAYPVRFACEDSSRET